MPKIGNFRESHEIPCDRCQSKRRISKKWTEKIKNNNGSFMVLYHTQIVCTNKKCQADFDAIIVEDNLKRERIKLAKELNKKPLKATV